MQKAALVILVLAVGVSGAMFFRKMPNDDAPPVDAPLVRKQEGAESATEPASTEKQGVPLPAAGDRSGRKETVADDQELDHGSSVTSQRNDAAKPGDSVAPEGTAMRSPPTPPPSFNNNVRPPLPKLSEFKDSERRSMIPLPYSSRPPQVPPEVAVKPTTPTEAIPREDKPAEPALRQHVIVNGDTLQRIARRYLGDASRAGEVLDWNRNVLNDPTVLPLGRTLKIPPRHSVPRRLPHVTNTPVKAIGGNATYDLVPLPNNALSRDG